MNEQLWPTLDTYGAASRAIKTGATSAYIVAGVTGLLGVASIIRREPVIGYDGWALVDASLFGIAGWRISKSSMTWCVIGLALWGLGLVEKVTSDLAPSGIVVSLLVTLGLVTGLRGILAERKLRQDPHAQVEGTS